MVRKFKVLNRRTFLVSGMAGGALLAAASDRAAVALAQDASRRSPAFELAYRQLLGEAEPLSDNSIHLELPEVPENGNTVPFKMWVDSPMTADDNIKTLHLLSTGNPQPRVSAFHFSPLSGKAQVAGRMRLARSQDVIALAERSDGQFIVAVRKVEVTIGGCGN
jgi:sulfur-oxidizing protein SoxY